MVAITILTLKIMPDSPSADLESIKAEAKKILESEGAQNPVFEETEIAFGLKAIMIKTAMPEERGTDNLENKLATIPQVSSVTVEDYRRAFG